MGVNKADLIQALAKENGLSKTQAEKAVGLLFDEMTEVLASGASVEVRGF